MRRMLLMAGVFAALAFAATAQAAEIRGEVVSKDATANTITVQTDDGQRMTFRVGDQATVRAQGQAADLAQVQTGDRVRITAQEAQQAGAERVAQAVEVEQRAGAAGETGAQGQMGQAGQQQPGRTTPAGMQEPGQQPDVAAGGRTGELPDTASPLPLIGLAGAVSLASGLALRRLRRR